MNIEKKYELIEKYLAGELTGEALIDFEKQLKENVDLRNELDLHRQVEATLKGEKVHHFRDSLKKADSRWKAPAASSNEKTRVFNFRRVASIAAAILLLFFAYQFFSTEDISNENLFADNFEPYQMVLNQRSGTDESANQIILNEAIKAYENKEFEKAVNSFQNLSTQEPSVIAYPFYEALAHMGAKNPSAAIPILAKIVDTPDHLFAEQSRWYLALANLQDGDNIAALKQLQMIQEGQFRFKEAQKILESID